jgi:sulfur transfer protein SufE
VNSKGCDSFVYLHLTVNDTIKKDSFFTTCKNQSIVFNGLSRNVTGIYRDTLVNSKGCDSFIYLHLTVIDTTKKDSFLTLCTSQSVIFNGISRNATGVYRDTLLNSKGCDSFVYLHLTVNDTTKKDSFLITCKNQPIVFNGISRNVSGIYRDTLVNSKGCDSFAYLHLTVNLNSSLTMYS